MLDSLIVYWLIDEGDFWVLHPVDPECETLDDEVRKVWWDPSWDKPLPWADGSTL